MWNKRQERSQSKTSSTGTDVPVTNIDDVVLRSSSSRGSSRPVFDSRKAMAGKRKVSTNFVSFGLCYVWLLYKVTSMLYFHWEGFVVAQTVINALSHCKFRT